MEESGGEFRAEQEATLLVPAEQWSYFAAIIDLASVFSTVEISCASSVSELTRFDRLAGPIRAE